MQWLSLNCTNGWHLLRWSDRFLSEFWLISSTCRSVYMSNISSGEVCVYAKHLMTHLSHHPTNRPRTLLSQTCNIPLLTHSAAVCVECVEKVKKNIYVQFFRQILQWRLNFALFSVLRLRSYSANLLAGFIHSKAALCITQIPISIPLVIPGHRFNFIFKRFAPLMRAFLYNTFVSLLCPMQKCTRCRPWSCRDASVFPCGLKRWSL